MRVCKIQFGPHSFILLIFGIFVLWKARRSSGTLQKNKYFTTHIPTGQSGFLISKWNLSSVIKPFSPAAFSAQTRAAIAPPL